VTAGRRSKKRAGAATSVSPGWNERRVEKVLKHYEAQSEGEAAAEDDAALEAEPRRTPAWGAIKAKLKGLSPTDLVDLVRDLYQASPANRQFLRGRLAPTAGDLERYRDRVIDAVYPDPFSRKPVRIGEAERLIRHYRLATRDESGTVDLMVSLAEAGTEQAVDLGFGSDESYFASLERLLESAVKAIPSLPTSARSSLVQRLRRLAERSESAAFGFGEVVREVTEPVTSVRARRAPSRPRFGR
jgi:hypothetical protein